MPRPGMPAEESAKLCSVYMRPWTLNKNDADCHVPHLLQLAQVPAVISAPGSSSIAGGPLTNLRGKRLSKKTPASECSAHYQVSLTSCNRQGAPGEAVDICCWRAAWEWYVKGHVVSDHASRVITNFLTNTMAKSAPAGDSSEEEDEAGTRENDHVRPLRPSLDTLHKILREQHGALDEDAHMSRARKEQARTIKRTRAMWEADCVTVGGDVDAVDTSGAKPSLRVQEYGRAARALGKQVANEAPMPFSGQTEPKVCIYGQGTPNVKEWLHDLRQSRIELTLPQQVDAHAVLCLEFAVEGASSFCRVSSTDCGFVQSWNKAHNGHRLKKGDQLETIDGQPYESEAATLAGVSASATVLTFKRARPMNSNTQCLPMLRPGQSTNGLRSVLAQ